MNQIKASKITRIAMLSAMAYIAVFVFRIPVVLFLKYDPKDIVIALGGFIWGPMTSFFVSLIVSVVEMLTISSTAFWGCLMNILSSCSFSCTAAVIYKKKRTLSGAVIGLLSGCVVTVAVMLLWNYLITPIYMGYPREAVVKLLLPAFLPFNLLKCGLNAAFTFLLYKPVITTLRKAGFVSSSQSGAAQSGKKPVGLLLVAGLVIVTCVLVILSMNKII